MKHLIIRPQVVDDLTEAMDWYNDQRNGLGDEFLQAAYDAFDVIADRSESFPIVDNDARRLLMKRFPYAIYFRSKPGAVVIYIVIHTARSADRWKKRL